MTGWAVNSIANAVEGSSPFLPIPGKREINKRVYLIFYIRFKQLIIYYAFNLLYFKNRLINYI